MDCEGADAAGVGIAQGGKEFMQTPFHIEVDSLSCVSPTTECHVAVADLALPRPGRPFAVCPTDDLEYARRPDRWHTFRRVTLTESDTCLPTEQWVVGELEGDWFPHLASKNECRWEERLAFMREQTELQMGREVTRQLAIEDLNEKEKW